MTHSSGDILKGSGETQQTLLRLIRKRNIICLIAVVVTTRRSVGFIFYRLLVLWVECLSWGWIIFCPIGYKYNVHTVSAIYMYRLCCYVTGYELPYYNWWAFFCHRTQQTSYIIYCRLSESNLAMFYESISLSLSVVWSKAMGTPVIIDRACRVPLLNAATEVPCCTHMLVKREKRFTFHPLFYFLIAVWEKENACDLRLTSMTTIWWLSLNDVNAE